MNTGQVCYNILTSGQGSVTIPNNIDIYTDILQQLSIQKITKLSVTAEPGIKLKINNTKEIMIGRTGVYEVEDVEITHLYFLKSKNYIPDDATDKTNIQEGLEAIFSGVNRIHPIIATKTEKPGSVGEYDYTFKVNGEDVPPAIINSYAEQIIVGYKQYQKGIQGSYKEDTTERVLHNIIIDYVYE